MLQLNPTEARVLGCLVEKEITTPEYYPLSLNALVNACNQKSSREPVMQLTEAEVRTALFDLENLSLTRTLSDARVSKFEHRVRDVLNLRRDEVAIVCLLLLRGPQTSAELRTRAERLFAFEDNAAALATLDRLARRTAVDGSADPLTALLARQPGAREARWMHLLCGPPDEALLAAEAASRSESSGTSGGALGGFSAATGTGSGGASGFAQRVTALEELMQSHTQLIDYQAQLLEAFEERLHALESPPADA